MRMGEECLCIEWDSQSTLDPFCAMIIFRLLSTERGIFMGNTSEDKAKNHLCLGILAHVDAGKTTLSEGILYKTGSIRKAGRVDHGDAFLDTEEMEKARGITIFSKQAVFALGDMGITLLDTPGHVDFSAEMERTLQVSLLPIWLCRRAALCRSRSSP